MEQCVETVLEHIWLNKEGIIQFNPSGKQSLRQFGDRDPKTLKMIADVCQEFQKLSSEKVSEIAGHDIFILNKIWAQLNLIAFTPKWDKFFQIKQPE